MSRSLRRKTSDSISPALEELEVPRRSSRAPKKHEEETGEDRIEENNKKRKLNEDKKLDVVFEQQNEAEALVSLLNDKKTLDHATVNEVALLRRDIKSVLDEPYLDEYLKNRFVRIKVVDFTGTIYHMAEIIGVVLSTSHKEKRLKVQVSPASQKIITLEDVSDHSITSNEFSVWKSQWDSMQFEVISAETALEIRDNSEALRSTTIAPITPHRGRARASRKSSVAAMIPLTQPTPNGHRKRLSGLSFGLFQKDSDDESASEPEPEEPKAEAIAPIPAEEIPIVPASRAPSKSKVWLSLNAEIDAVRNGTHTLLCQKVTQAEEKYKHELEMAAIMKEKRLHYVEMLYENDLKHARDQAEEDKTAATELLLQELMAKQKSTDVYVNNPTEDETVVGRIKKRTRGVKQLNARDKTNFKSLRTTCSVAEVRAEIASIKSKMNEGKRSKRQNQELNIRVDNGRLTYSNMSVKKGDTIVLEEDGATESFQVNDIGTFDLQCSNEHGYEYRVLIAALKSGKYTIIDVHHS